MSIARAFTVRRQQNKNEQTSPAPYIGRAASQRAPNSKPIERQQISLPVALISTTNMLSYEAPDIEGTPRIMNTYRNTSSASSVSSEHSSGDESDHSSISARSNGTAATSVDDYSPMSPEPNHLSCYFKPAGTTSETSNRASHSTTASSRPSFDSPVIPQRAPSHSKNAHVLSHKRSMQRVGSVSHTRQTSRSSVDMFNKDVSSAAPATHPFGKELEQLNEAAEEFGHAVRDAEEDADRAIMRTKNLAQFCANDYLSELTDLYGHTFKQDAAVYQPMVWI